MSMSREKTKRFKVWKHVFKHDLKISLNTSNITWNLITLQKSWCFPFSFVFRAIHSNQDAFTGGAERQNVKSSWFLWNWAVDWKSLVREVCLTSVALSLSMASLSARISSSSCWFSLFWLSLSEMCLASMSMISAAWSSCICPIFSVYPAIISSMSSAMDGSVCVPTSVREPLRDEDRSDWFVEFLWGTEDLSLLVSALLFIPWCSLLSPFFPAFVLGWDGGCCSGASLDLAKAVCSSWTLTLSSAMDTSLTWARQEELELSPQICISMKEVD